MLLESMLQDLKQEVSRLMNPDVERVKDLVAAFQQEENIQAGDKVQWKDGMKSYVFPAYGQPCVVVETFTPIINTKDPGTYYFADRLDMRLGFIDKDGDLKCYAYDSRRFRKVQ